MGKVQHILYSISYNPINLIISMIQYDRDRYHYFLHWLQSLGLAIQLTISTPNLQSIRLLGVNVNQLAKYEAINTLQRRYLNKFVKMNRHYLFSKRVKSLKMCAILLENHWIGCGGPLRCQSTHTTNVKTKLYPCSRNFLYQETCSFEGTFLIIHF